MKKFWSEEGGAVATEYALIITFIAFLIVVGVGIFGASLNDWFTTAASSVDTMATNADIS